MKGWIIPMKMYELNDAIRNFEFEIDEETGEILNADELEKLEIEREEKLENLACWFKELNAESEAILNESKVLKSRAERVSKQADRVKSYIALQLNGEELKSNRVVVTWKKSESTEITDITQIPEQYIKTKIETTADKTAIKKAIKAGEYIKGARIINNNNMSIN